MARNKHSTALFEVIHSAKKPGRVAQSLRTPKWWFKSEHKSPVTPPAPAEVYSEPEPVTVIQPEREVAAPPSRSRLRPSRGEGSSRFRFGFDRGNQEVTFRLRYTTALVTGFAVCVIVGVSYIVGRHLGGPKTAAAADQPSVKELLQQPPRPNVTTVARPKPAGPLVSRGQTPKPLDTARQPALASNVVTPKRDVGSTIVPASADTTMPRKPGLSYLVIHSYSPDRLANGQAARDYFNKNGIPCTLEKTAWTLGANWVTLVGTAGFSKTNTEDFETYVNRTAALAKAWKSANFDRPLVSNMNRYSWRPTDGESK